MHSKKRRLRPNDAGDGNFLNFFVCIIVLAVRITFVSNRHTRAGIQKPSDRAVEISVTMQNYLSGVSFFSTL